MYKLSLGSMHGTVAEIFKLFLIVLLVQGCGLGLC